MGTRGPKATPPKQGESKDLLVTLAADLNVDLWAFCDAHYGASQTRIICEALREFIDRRLESEPHMRQRFTAARERLLRPVAEIVQLPDPVTRSADRKGR